MRKLDLSPVSNSFETTQLNRIRRFTGNYYRVLGWIGLFSMVVSIATAYWIDSLNFDISFIFWFWLGRCLNEGNPTARKWAIAISLIFSGAFIYGLISPGAKASFGGFQLQSSHPAYGAILVFFTLVFAIPGLVLSTKNGRAAFPNAKVGEKDVLSDGG